MRLFRKSEEKIAREEAAQEEIARLRALNTEELASVVLPGLGPAGPSPGHYTRPQQLCEYLLRDFPGIGQTKPLQLMAPVRRALNQLEDDGLVSSMAYERSPVWRITSAGTSALADGSAEARRGRGPEGAERPAHAGGPAADATEPPRALRKGQRGDQAPPAGWMF